MDIEQLKLVLEMVGTATEGAMWFAFAWLAKGAVIDLVGWSLVGFAIYKLASVLMAALDNEKANKEREHDNSGAQSFLAQMRDADPSINTALKYGSITVADERAIKLTHRRGCEAILAERHAK